MGCARDHSSRQFCNLRTVNLKVLLNLLKYKRLKLTRENSLMIAINIFVFYNVEVYTHFLRKKILLSAIKVCLFEKC